MLFQKLRYFVAVAECGSFNHAAEQLFISQQSLRASMNSIEESLGFPLFLRSSRGIQLTEQGMLVLEDVKQILSISEKWNQYVPRKSVGSETVQVLASTVVCNTVLNEVVTECRTRFPNLCINFYHSRDDEMMQKLDSHSIGVLGSAPETIITNRIRPFAKAAGLNFAEFGNDRFCVYINTKNPLARLPHLTTDNLKDFTLAAYPGEDKRFFYNRIHRFFSNRPPFFIEKQENIFKMIAEQEDVAGVFPHLAVINNHYVEQGLITALPVKNFPMPGKSCIMYPLESSMTPGQKVVIDLIREKLDSLLRYLSKDFE